MADAEQGLVQALRASEARLADAERLAHLGSWVWDAAARTLTWSEEMYRIFGMDPECGPIGLDTYREAIHVDDRAHVEASIRRTIESLEPFEYECRVMRPDGEVRWLHSRAEATLGPDGSLVRITGFGQDVTERRLAEDRHRDAQEQLARHQAVLRRIARNEPLAQTLDRLCREIEERYPQARCSVLLVDDDEPVLRHAAAPSLPEEVTTALDGLPIAVGMGACGTAAFRREPVVVHDTLTDPLIAPFVELAVAHSLRSVWSQPLLDPNGETLGTFAVYRSVPHRPDHDEIEAVRSAAGLAGLAIERARSEQALMVAANLDPLTGLPNRNQFLERLTERLEETGELAVMFLDLDRFKWINDSLGHPTGDKILVQVSDRLGRVLRGGDVLVRFGGDEFTIMVNDADSFAVDRIAVRVEDAFAAPFVLDGGEFFLSVSIGTALADGSCNAFDLVRDADAAMYAAKDAGRARHALFDDRLRQRALSRVTLESELRRGIERHEFTLHYQPIHDVRAGEWTGVEALARWQHPTRGLLFPDEFIPLAEETGLITALGQQLIDRAVGQAALWMRVGHKTPVAANLSVVQLSDPDFPEQLHDALRRHGVPAELLLVEVTETGVMERLDAARVALERIAGLGVRVLIDDFGTGYSSIARLRELPVVGVKVDRAFTRQLGEEGSAGTVLAAITDLAHALDLSVVAEGIETEVARDLATELGCDFLQGYQLARPAPPEELTLLFG
jgi:c-di-GMP-specific phosphodiesterase